MKKITSLLICLFFFGCATSQEIKVATEGITFETGMSREAVMDAIIKVTNDEGFAIATISEKYGIITCQPKNMPTGEMLKKTGDSAWGWTSKVSAWVHEVQFSANVSETGVVRLRVVVGMNTPEHKTVDSYRSAKLARYYEQKIRDLL